MIRTIQPTQEEIQDTLAKADIYLSQPCPHITDIQAPMSSGTIHDYYSNADYWWPNPDTPDGLPYVQRDGESYPGNFFGHRIMLRKMRSHSAALAAAYQYTGKEQYAQKAVEILREFFLDPATKMNPALPYAQAIPGISTGRGIGIIDTLHFIDIPFAVKALEKSPALTEEIQNGLKDWFSQYLGWMLHHPNGQEEMNTSNNHAVCFFVQAAAFALFTDNKAILDLCKRSYETVLIPQQMAEDGSFPRELGRTKPYNYSIFVLDNMVTLCHLLSKAGMDLWNYTAENGKSITKGIDFLLPYLLDRSKWPYPKDVEHFESYPVRVSCLLFAGVTLNRDDLLQLFYQLPRESNDKEIRRNVAVRQPWLWL